MATLADVLKAIADDKSLVIFNTIALSNIGSEILICRLQLTRKQYYSRMSTFLKTGLVKREMGKYSLTTFGMILYHAQEIIEKAVNQIWKLKAIDSISVSCNGKLPQEQFLRIIDTLIANQEIKNILLEQIKEKSPIFETLNQIPVPNLDQNK